MRWMYGLISTGILLAIFVLKLGKKIQIGRRSNALGLHACHYHFNNSERAFLSVLEKAAGSHYYVIGKVKAFEILQLETKASLYSKLISRLFREYYFDYVVCAAHSNEIVCVVELEKLVNEKQVNPRWAELLETLMQVFCAQSELPRLIVSEQRGYDLNELIERFEAVTASVEIPSQVDDSYVL